MPPCHEGPRSCAAGGRARAGRSRWLPRYPSRGGSRRGKGETATPPINGANPVRNLVPEVVTDAAPTVRPWKPPWKAITLGRPVACRASRRADSTASLPELAKTTEPSPAGSTSPSRCVSCFSGWCITVVYWPWMSRATCSWAAAATLGWQWPVLVTPIPAVKSRYSRPRMSVSTAPRPVATWTAVACLRIGDSVAGIEAPLHRACDGAAWRDVKDGMGWDGSAVLGVDGVGERTHRREGPVRGHVSGRGRCGAPAGVGVTAVDPHRRQARGLGRHVVVEQALRHVQQLPLADPEPGEFAGQRLEVAGGRLVGADVLRGEDAGEGDAQTLVRAGEAGPVHVGQDDELVATRQPLQRLRRVGERRPVGHGDRQRLGLVVADRHTQLAPQATHRPREDQRVAIGGVLDLRLRLAGGVRRQQLLVAQLQTVRIGPWAQHGGDAGLPVDEGPVAVEAEGVEVAEVHRARSWMAPFSRTWPRPQGSGVRGLRRHSRRDRVKYGVRIVSVPGLWVRD